MIKRILSIAIVSLSVLSFVTLTSQTEAKKLVEPDNKNCLQCHGNNYYSYHNEELDKEVHKKMNPYFVINKNLFSKGVHNSFTCTDCHMEEYSVYPHDANLKLEAKYGCIDCHGEDENFAKFHFDEISLEVQESVHGLALKDNFTCEMCHNPHYYQLESRNKSNIKEIVKNSNAMCLNCHNYTEDRFYLLSDSNISINSSSHKWLPNQELHFNNVRCIECHGTQEKTDMVSHGIRSKEHALKLCVECHSSNSMLMASLFRHKSKENRDQYGFINGAMMNESFVVGANNNYYLNAISIIIFSLLILVLIGHALLRIILKK
jgi:predicted CXXCH cytochrome family protein